MDRPQFIRRLRIAASVFFAVVAVALCVLWMRSYDRNDYFEREAPHKVGIISANGEVQILHETQARPGAVVTSWRHSIVTRESTSSKPRPWRLRFPGVTSGGKFTFVTIPYWSAAAITISLAVVSLLELRFSLRTLLIATTLVAVVLGLGVWAAR